MHAFINIVDPPGIFSKNIHVVACEYYEDQYQDSLYEAYGIPFHQISSRAVVKRKAEFLAGRHCANLCLRHFGETDFVIKSGENREPQWPKNIVGAISHSKNYAIVITANASCYLGIGVDVENLVTTETANKLKCQIFTQVEDEKYSHQENFDRIFTICFSLKESFFKAAYPRVKKYFDFSAVIIKKIEWIDKQFGTIHFELNEDLCEQYQSGQTFRGRFYESNDQVITTVELKAN